MIKEESINLNDDINSVAQEFNQEVKDNRTSSEELVRLCRKVAAEGCVLLKNEDNVLPLNNNDEVALFGRCQQDYFFVGYGSGGDVKAPYKISPLKAFIQSGKNINKNISNLYENYIKDNPVCDGTWGNWPTCYEEMEINEDDVKNASITSNKAIIFIGRSSGEDRENLLEKGSYYLTVKEERLFQLVTKYFKQVIVIINSGSLIDFSFLDKYKTDALLLSYQNGQESGNGLVDILYADVTPSAKLPDTIADINYYPSTKGFGNTLETIYSEDIYVGYRYFNTFNKEKIRFPFGFGLSYTNFNIELVNASSNKATFKVLNSGLYNGSEVIQIYYSKPNNKLDNPSFELLNFYKTKDLNKGEEQVINIDYDIYNLLAYDDENDSYIIEKGIHKLYYGTDSINLLPLYEFNILEDIIVKKSKAACIVKKSYKRLKNVNNKEVYEDIKLKDINLKDRIINNLPSEYKKINIKYNFNDVINNKISLDEFISSLDENELEELSRGSLKGMNAPFAPSGNAGTMGASSIALRDRGIPTISTNDGPSGIRLQAHATLIPIGTSLAATFNTNLVEELMSHIALEMRELKSHVILAPGMNIHRNPLCGRNFEYFSEDVILTAKMASSFVKGIQSKGISATLKHYACNNQETNRTANDSVVSERALREIYLKVFELVIKEANPDCVMNSYNKINGTYAYYNYDLNTTLLREEYGFKGLLMTDWWTRNDKSLEFKNIYNQAYRVRSGNNVLMPGSLLCGECEEKSDGSLLDSLTKEEGITLGELQNNAKVVLRLCLKHYK